MILCTCDPAITEGQLPYDVNRPELVADLPKQLKEISGLGSKGDELYAIEDEDGVLFVLDRDNGSLIGLYDFAEDGDYEGVDVVGDEVWVARSDGHLYQIRRVGQEDQDVTEYKTFLTDGNDVEGLFYDAPNNRLLLACKDDPKGNGLDNENRYVFAFDLNSRRLEEEPVISFERMNNFSPSAIAIHPQSSEIYLLSSVGKQMVILTPEGKFKSLHKLRKSLFGQPEGLTFTPDGTMYISTEARGGNPARIYRLPLLP